MRQQANSSVMLERLWLRSDNFQTFNPAIFHDFESNGLIVTDFKT
ncbi:MAG: hypothetical protein WBA89_28570 [Microcoleus sp.]